MPTIQQLVRKGRVKIEDKSKAGFLPTEKRSLCTCLHYHSEKTELSHEKGCPC